MTPIEKKEEEKGFGGLYDLFHASVSQSQWQAQVQIKMKLSSATKKQDEGIGQTIEKANITFTPNILKGFGATCGIGCPLYAPGCFFPVIEDYTLSSRWGKTGFSLHYLSKNKKSSSSFGIDAGLCLPFDTGTSSYKFCEKGFRLNSFLSFWCKEAVLSFIFDFDSAGNNTNKKAPYNNLYDFSPKDRTFSFFLKNIFHLPKDYFVDAMFGASWNSTPLLAIPMSSSVLSAKYNDIPQYEDTSIMKSYDFWQLATNIKLCFGSSYLLFEAEGGISRQQKKDFGNMEYIYQSTQLYFPLKKCLAVKSHITYYSVFFSDCQKDFGSCLEFFPRMMFFSGKNSFSLAASYSLIRESHTQHSNRYSFPIWWKHSF